MLPFWCVLRIIDCCVWVSIPLQIVIGPRVFGPTLGPTQLWIQWVPGALTRGVKRPGREAVTAGVRSIPLSLSSLRVKRTLSYFTVSFALLWFFPYLFPLPVLFLPLFTNYLLPFTSLTISHVLHFCLFLFRVCCCVFLFHCFFIYSIYRHCSWCSR
jgi:hypothetical protein